MEEIIQELIALGKVYGEKETYENQDIIQKIYTTLTPFFEKEFEQAISKEQFLIPEDYKGFLLTLGGRTIELGGNYGTAFFNAETVIANTEHWGGVGDSVKEVWLNIGEYSDKHWYFLCCDSTSTSYGKIVDGYDATPWMGYNFLDFEANSILPFLLNTIKDYDR
ncbi:MAG: hypothetical protein GY810_23580 [Aureispira sp.]|nr:hypothetical protein [Aureispira sp.]